MLTKRTPKGGPAAPGATAFSKAGNCHGPRQPENLPKRLPARSARSIRPSAGTPSPEQASFKTCLLVVKRAVRGLGAGSASITASALSSNFWRHHRPRVPVQRSRRRYGIRPAVFAGLRFVPLVTSRGSFLVATSRTPAKAAALGYPATNPTYSLLPTLTWRSGGSVSESNRPVHQRQTHRI